MVLKRVILAFQNLSLSLKVGLGVVFLLLIVAGMTTILHFVQLNLERKYTQTVEEFQGWIEELQTIKSEHLRWKVNLLTHLLNEDFESIILDESLKKIEQLRAKIRSQVDNKLWQSLEESAKEMNQLVLAMKKVTNEEELWKLYNRFQTVSRSFLWESLDKLIEEYQRYLTLEKRKFDRQKKMLQVAYLIGLLFILLLTLYGSRFIGKRLERELDRAIGSCREISQGNLRIDLEVERNDEVGKILRALDEVRCSFNEIILNIKKLGEEIEPIVASFKELGETSHAKAMFIEMRIDEVLMEVDEIIKDIQEQTNIIGQIRIAVEEINKTVLETQYSANRAMNQALETQRLMVTLERASAEIESIVEFIRGVAEQTNLLALNASIEAARAGEVGKGFAVVAQEVKELARQTDNAGVEITQKIKALQELHANIIRTVETMVEVFQQVKDHANIVASAIEEQTIALADIEKKALTHQERAELASRAFKDLEDEFRAMNEDIQKNLNYATQLEDFTKRLISSVEHFATFQIDRRLFKRIRFFEEARFEVDGKSYNATLRDISLSGIYLLSSYIPKVDQKIKFYLKCEESWVEFEGKVVRTDGSGFAVIYEYLSPESISKIERILRRFLPEELVEREISKLKKLSIQT